MIDRFVDEHAYLGNFGEGKSWVYGDVYDTLEGAFHAAKWPPVVGNEPVSRMHALIRAEIRKVSRSPGRAKQLGRRKNPPIRRDWDTWRLEAMELLARRKFGLEPHPTNKAVTSFARRLGVRLLSTAPHVLVEGNDHGDDFWGAVPVVDTVTVGAEAMIWRNLETGRAWRGQNHLGRILARVRDDL